jgi:hypothetical protein
MLNWIDVNVVEVCLEIALIADRVLPIAPLPDGLLILGYEAAGALTHAEPISE